MVLTFVLLPMIGHLADKAPSKIVIPSACLLRAIAAAAFTQLTDPRQALTIASCSFVILASCLENVAVEVLFMRQMPGDVRGAMNGVFHFCGQVGILWFSQIGGRLFDTVGPAAPFGFLAFCDVVLFVIALGMICCGKL